MTIIAAKKTWREEELFKDNKGNECILQIQEGRRRKRNSNHREPGKMNFWKLGECRWRCSRGRKIGELEKTGKFWRVREGGRRPGNKSLQKKEEETGITNKEQEFQYLKKKKRHFIATTNTGILDGSRT